MSSRRGNARENAVLELLAEDGWFGLCGRASRGPADILAVRSKIPNVLGRQEPTRSAARIIVVQVKSDVDGPYENFRQMERIVLADIAERIGAEAWAAWWPPHGTLRWIHSSEWPAPRRGVPAMRPV
jgi:Holliday junction resolvase